MGRLKVMGKDDEAPIVRLSRSDRVAILGIVTGVFVAIGGAAIVGWLQHDRDIVGLKEATASGALSTAAEMLALRADIAEARADIKTLLQSVSRLEAKLDRQAMNWPPPYGVGQ